MPGSGYAGDVAVPLWAGFMKAATGDDKPEWCRRRAASSTVQVCRLSGKRPAGGCDAVPVVDDGGDQSERSMVYTEYFVRGTEPEEHCHLHVGRSLFGQHRRLVRRRARRPSQNRAADVAPAEKPPDAAPVSPAQQAPEVAAAPEDRRRSAASGRGSSAGATSPTRRRTRQPPRRPR